MKTWAVIGLTLVGTGHGLLSGGVAFADEESPYCAKAEAEAHTSCDPAMFKESCIAAVDGKMYYWRADCDNTLKGIYDLLCLHEVTDHSPVRFKCCDLASSSWACKERDEPT
ncbi:hypothetical protein [Sorangium sp. So ce1182]|uniref:hypothetical protein n=1 Tax=Sorangium sp. So ce1182 TaxID=3133334 RepID=UPI003F5FED53